MFQFLKKAFWNLSSPWPDRSVEKRVRGLTIMRCEEARFPECVQLLEDNMAHGVPPNHQQEYLGFLGSGRALTLIAEHEGKVVGTFGIQYGQATDVLLLSYLLVAPECHRGGVGTTLFFAALAMLPEEHQKVSVRISALPGAVDFYRRFGFRPFNWEMDLEGRHYVLAALPVSCVTSVRCRELLAEAGTTLPPKPYRIPLRSPNVPTAAVG